MTVRMREGIMMIRAFCLMGIGVSLREREIDIRAVSFSFGLFGI